MSEELQTKEQFRLLIAVLMNTESGKAILRGERKDYPLEYLKDDLDNAMSQTGAHYAHLRGLVDLALRSCSGGDLYYDFISAFITGCRALIERSWHNRIRQ